MSPRLVSRGAGHAGSGPLTCCYVLVGGVHPVGGRGCGRPWLDARGRTGCWPRALVRSSHVYVSRPDVSQGQLQET